MQRKDKFKIAFINVKKNKSKYMVGCIFVVCVMIIVFSFSLYKSFNIILSTEKNNFYGHYFFLIYDYDNVSFENIQNKLLLNNHILSVEKVENSEQSLNLEKISTTKMEERTVLVGTVNTLDLNIIYGRGLEKNDEIVCPVNFYPYDDLEYNKNINRNDVIYMKDYLNKELTFSYLDNSNNIHLFNYKLVGVYANSIFDYDENKCFVLTDELKEISSLKKLYIEKEDDEGIEAPIVLIDNYDNAQIVMSELKEDNIYLSASFQPNEILYSLLPLLIFIIVIICCSVSIIILVLLVNKKIKDNRGNLSLLKAFGYSNKDVVEILFYENLILNVIYVFIGIIITLLIYFILKIIVYFKPFYFGKMSISYSFVSIPTCLLIAIILSFISVIFFRKDINDLDIINILREDD